MKKTAVAVVVMSVYLVLSSGPILGCELCDPLKTLGYTEGQIVREFVFTSKTQAEAKKKMREAIAEKKKPEKSAVSTEPNKLFAGFKWNGKYE